MDVITLDEVGSTNDECLRLALAGAPSGAAVAARRQTAGRGRRGRPWVTLDGDNVFVSVLWRTELAPERVSGVTLDVGRAVAEALDGFGARVLLEWPNDLVVGGKKLGGILCELHQDERGAGRFVVVGVGLDVGARAFPGELAELATSLAEHLGEEAPRADEVLTAVVSAIRTALSDYEARGRPDLTRWQARAAGVGEVGRRVRAADGREGVVQGIASDGALLLIWDGRLVAEPMLAGELVALP